MAYTGNVVSGLPDWNPDISVIAEPPNDKKLTGWQPDEKPPAQWFNWLNAGFYKSIKEIDDMFNKTSGHGHTGVDGDAPKLDPTKAFTYAPVNKAGDTMDGKLTISSGIDSYPLWLKSNYGEMRFICHSSGIGYIQYSTNEFILSKTNTNKFDKFSMFATETIFHGKIVTEGQSTKVRRPHLDTGGWARGFVIEDRDASPIIELGSYGNVVGGVNTVNWHYIGEAFDDTFIRFYPDKKITFDGVVGIGTTHPLACLSIQKAGAVDNVNLLNFSEIDELNFTFKGMFAGGGADGNSIKLDTLWANNVMVWRGNGNVGIGIAEPAYPLDVKGIVRADGQRAIQFDPGTGRTKIKGLIGGWTLGYFFEGSDNAFLGGFGAYGNTNALNYYYIGTDHNNPLVRIMPDGTLRAKGAGIFSLGASAVQLVAGSGDHTYMSFYPRTATPGTRGGYIGYGSAGTTTMAIKNEIGNIFLSPHGGTVNLDGELVTTGDIESNGVKVLLSDGSGPMTGDLIMEGRNIKIRRPSISTGGWAKSFVVEDRDETRLISFGSFGNVADGVNTVSYHYLGRAYNDTFMRFYENNRVSVDGSLGIGTVNPLGKIGIQNTGSIDDITLMTFAEGDGDTFALKGMFAGAGGEGNSIKLQTTWADNVMVWRGDGKVGIGMAYPTHPLDVNGIVRSNGLRAIELDPEAGRTKIKGLAGGWNLGYFFEGSDDAFLGGFGAHGGTNILNYYYIGTEYNNPLLKIQPDGIIKSKGDKIVFRIDSIEDHGTNGLGRISVNYYGYQGGTTQYRDFRVYDGKTGLIAHFDGETKEADFNGRGIFNGGAGTIRALPGNLDHTYLAFYPRTATPETRGGYIGYGSAGSTMLSINNETGDIRLSPHGGTVNVDGDIEINNLKVPVMKEVLKGSVTFNNSDSPKIFDINVNPGTHHMLVYDVQPTTYVATPIPLVFGYKEGGYCAFIATRKSSHKPQLFIQNPSSSNYSFNYIVYELII